MMHGDTDYYTICPHCLRDNTYQLRFQNPRGKQGSFIKGTCVACRTETNYRGGDAGLGLSLLTQEKEQVVDKELMDRTGGTIPNSLRQYAIMRGVQPGLKEAMIDGLRRLHRQEGGGRVGQERGVEVPAPGSSSGSSG